MAVWHMPWTEKDDTLDWQAYFHLRNKLVAALLHSPFPRGGKVVREALTHTTKHLVAMQYSPAHLRLKAIEDVLSGPEHLHATLATVLPEVRRIRSQYADAQASQDVTAFPPPLRKPRRGDREPAAPGNMVSAVKIAAAGVVRQLLPVKSEAESHPEAAVPAMDAKWWRLSRLDSAVVSTADGTSASFYKRDREMFNALSRKSVALHQQLLSQWPDLAARYREAFGHLVSTQMWSETFTELQEARESDSGQRSGQQ
jgi:galactofuranosylgalactofuranosylrhamnosyl-N-acetylglucosaminyl-diphospho-decaprenol beta-1,5/1,6-galactofuranosyltransferase